MTDIEAKTRAQRIWGDLDFLTVSAVSSTHGNARWWISFCYRYQGTAWQSEHAFDQFGHAICHPECTLLERLCFPGEQDRTK